MRNLKSIVGNESVLVRALNCNRIKASEDMEWTPCLLDRFLLDSCIADVESMSSKKVNSDRAEVGEMGDQCIAAGQRFFWKSILR